MNGHDAADEGADAADEGAHRHTWAGAADGGWEGAGVADVK